MTVTLTHRFGIAATTLLLGTSLTLTACGTDDASESVSDATASEASEASYPLTVTIGDEDVELAAEPEKCEELVADLTGQRDEIIARADGKDAPSPSVSGPTPTSR
ncbi:hypothetical protein [Corynebacterium variabile]|uniref:hypothetical protein n=1 Tax=Corynebacterium variabile TaxID=1727 RepID=UPI002FE2E585